jgi:hypothetical protein
VVKGASQGKLRKGGPFFAGQGGFFGAKAPAQVDYAGKTKTRGDHNRFRSDAVIGIS